MPSSSPLRSSTGTTTHVSGFGSGLSLIEGLELRRKTDCSEVKATISLQFLRHSGNPPSPTQHPYACRVAYAGRQEKEREGPTALA